ncbi:hypothetical protein C5E02_14990, partial [Rathayibacter rathayi]
MVLSEDRFVSGEVEGVFGVEGEVQRFGTAALVVLTLRVCAVLLEEDGEAAALDVLVVVVADAAVVGASAVVATPSGGGGRLVVARPGVGIDVCSAEVFEDDGVEAHRGSLSVSLMSIRPSGYGGVPTAADAWWSGGRGGSPPRVWAGAFRVGPRTRSERERVEDQDGGADG